MTTIYHNPRCSKSRAALDLLEARGMAFTTIKYLESPPSESELSTLIKQLGSSAEQLVRKGEKVFKELGLGDANLSEKEWIQTMIQNPKLIERPIVVHDGKAAIGRPIDNIIAILDR